MAGSRFAEPHYAELHCTTHFSLLQAASHPDELVEQASSLGYSALAITDRATLAGIVRAHSAAKRVGLKLLIGATLEPIEATGCMGDKPRGVFESLPFAHESK